MLGVFHATRGKHAALASDLQEPFRHLVDRAVWAAASELSERDFSVDARSEYPVRIHPAAMRAVMAVWYRILALGCHVANGSNGTYAVHIFRQARSFRRSLSDKLQPFESFQHIT